ncbi:MAG: UDP-N-acetylmuramoyl-tripeptide--D-alanyl-D-alanine ligase [Clostridiaceae bacterium]|nr:UDP-N-acetylmuramoyl-tripeptide--D-alanyl-D-alanine ligase [Clostridiaceae bacterium]
MDRMRADKIAAWMGGKLTGNPGIETDAVSTDTRTLKPGSMFFAIRGKNFDGHDFIDKAYENGAVIAVSNIDITPPEGKAAVVVEDTVLALGRLAEKYLETFNIPVIAVTGSVGKTTTKEMTAQILSTQYNVHKSTGNYNNNIGLPLSVLQLERGHTAAVFELGMNALGEIEYLSRIIHPDIAVITNIGVSHYEKLGSRQNILRAKLEVTKGMKDNGVLILNGDDKLLSGLNGLLSMPVVYYGINEDVPLRAIGIETMGEKGVRFTVNLRNEDVEIVLPVPGIHQVSNALAAIACGIELGIENDNIIKGLSCYSQEKMRLDIVSTKGVKIINDTYNAAPSSMQAALSVLREVAGENRSIAVLGDMYELGSIAGEAHKEVGRAVVHERVNYLVAVGELAGDYCTGAIEAGMDEKNVRHYKNADDAVPYLKSIICPDDVVLFKGSRGMNMDRLLKAVFDLD